MQQIIVCRKDEALLCKTLGDNANPIRLLSKDRQTIDTITLPGLETEVAVTDIRVSRDVISHATVTLFSST